MTKKEYLLLNYDGLRGDRMKIKKIRVMDLNHIDSLLKEMTIWLGENRPIGMDYEESFTYNSIYGNILSAKDELTHFLNLRKKND